MKNSHRKYSGALTKKLPPVSLLSSAENIDQFKSMAIARHNALFQEFGLEPPAPNDKTNPVWRDLALALARRHVPAFMLNAGAPRDEALFDKCIKLHRVSRYFRVRDGGTISECDKKACKQLGLEYGVMRSPLKEFRRRGRYKIDGFDLWTEDGAFDKFLLEIQKALGKEALIRALEPDDPSPLFEEEIEQQVHLLRNYPYE